MLSCTEICCYIFLSILRNLESNSDFLLRNTISLLTQNLEKREVILTCFTKIIGKQSSVIQYA